MNLRDTQEIQSRRVSLTKIHAASNVKHEGLIGWEAAPPQEGESYVINLRKGRLLRTSPVVDIAETEDALLIRTLNSLYEVKYLK
jgi:hypothetical protein